MRILVTGVLGPAGAALTRQLVERGHDVVGCDMADGTLAGITVHLVPAATDLGLVPMIARIAREEQVDLVVPTVSEELLSFAAATAAFDVPVVVSPPAGVAVADDKLRTMWALQRAGVSVPGFAAASDLPAADEAYAALGTPLIAKPRVSRGGRGVQILEVGQPWPELDDTQILQEFAPGEEFAPVVWVAERPEDDVVAVIRKTELKQGRVGNAASVVRDDTDATRDIAELAVAAARALGLMGPVDMDIRRREDGTPVVLEINARFGANSEAAPELVERLLA